MRQERRLPLLVERAASLGVFWIRAWRNAVAGVVAESGVIPTIWVPFVLVLPKSLGSSFEAVLRVGCGCVDVLLVVVLFVVWCCGGDGTRLSGGGHPCVCVGGECVDLFVHEICERFTDAVRQAEEPKDS